MSKIKVMDELLANKIAAGEVVEKCVSIVKELVENSIDAKATEIKIELKEAGIREIKVIDNGIGMDRDDAILAFQRHATSKLYNVDDLFNISSLGFRGEALPSIASVSEVILKTCQSSFGTLIHIKGGHIVEDTTCEARTGTNITVSNLFYNTPARLKHLSSIYSELANISDYVNKMALSYPKVKFRLINDEKELLNTDGSGNLLKVIKAIYGLDVTKKMLSVSASNDDYQVNGYISMPEINRASRNYMTTLVNGRVIKNASLNKVINEAYSSFKEDTRYPIVVLNIITDPSLIDVNVHPSKLDIKFSNFDDLKTLIKDMITDKIKEKLLIPKIEAKEVVTIEKPVKYANLSLNLDRNMIKEKENTYGVSYQEQLTNLVNFNDNTDLEELEIEDIEAKTIENIEDANNKLPELYPVGLALGTYIVCENEKGVYLIDQHAAQERINYEKYSYLLSHPSKNTIDTIVPIVIELPMNEFLILKKNISILESLNIKLEEFGQCSFRITSHPTWFPKDNPDKIIRSIFEQIIKEEKNFNLAKFNDHLAATIACKASIKANTRITIEDMESIINQLRLCNNPFNCPHGRPVVIEFTIYELEKMFKRSI
ncbi:MAG: DNA mismatch repair endonuclease MutL [Bacilli bacterium]|nr:DNA mismatch repair endonuclease MutL [Bacilli bacterium]